MAKVGILGSGSVGDALAAGFLAHGHAVRRGTREPGKLAGWAAAAGSQASVGTFEDAARFGDLVVLAVKGTAAEATVTALGAALDGKPVIDATNPIADVPPQDGLLTFFTGPNESLMERLQRRAPRARFVKAFSCVGAAHMVAPSLPGGPPTMFLCGDDPAAKAVVTDVLRTFGWAWEDLGGAASARAIEPLCMLWCLPGFRQNRWNHAFKLLKP